MAANLNLSKANVNRVAASLTETNVSFFTVSPNPTTGQFVLSNAKFVAGSTYPLDIYDASGTNIFQKTLSNQQETINFVAPGGVYFVNLNTQDGLAVRKLTKQ